MLDLTIGVAIAITNSPKNNGQSKHFVLANSMNHMEKKEKRKRKVYINEDLQTFLISLSFLTILTIIKLNNLTEFFIIKQFVNYTTIIFCQYFQYNYCLNESLITVGTETLGQTCFFLRQRETRFENLKTTHRVDLDKPKVG